jgi:hypothetical protein
LPSILESVVLFSGCSQREGDDVDDHNNEEEEQLEMERRESEVGVRRGGETLERKSSMPCWKHFCWYSAVADAVRARMGM